MSKAIGESAEGLAAKYLENRGFVIIARNWKNRWCEIDIVAKTGERIHFVEVKYRKLPYHGSGFDYITRRKLKQMQFAALQWVSEHDWQSDYQLDAVAVEGELSTARLIYLPNVLGI